MNENNLIQTLNNFDQLDIAVIGDIMLDRYIWGEVERISPEAPVPVVNIENKENRVGGAGNVATNLASLKCNSTVFSVTGEDNHSKALKNKIKAHNVDPYFTIDGSRNTTLKSRVVAQRQQLVRLDQEDLNPIDKNIEDKLINSIISNEKDFDAMILSDYNKGVLTPELIKSIISKFKDIPIIVDPKVKDYSRYTGATFIKPNYKEFCQAVNESNIELSSLKSHAKDFVSKYNLQGVVITLGENGVFYYDDKNGSNIIPTEAHEVYDVSGAGDTFTAVFTAAYTITQELPLASEIGNYASAVAVEKVGTAAVTKEEVLKKIKNT